MDTPNSQYIETLIRLQRLRVLLKSCIEIEEYHLCSQIRDMIERREREITHLKKKEWERGESV